MLRCRHPVLPRLLILLLVWPVACDPSGSEPSPVDSSTTGTGKPADAGVDGDSGTPSSASQDPTAIDHDTVAVPYEGGTVDYDEAARLLQEELARDEDPLENPPPGSGIRRLVTSEKPLRRLRELTAEELPVRTRAKPDPTQEQFKRFPLYVKIDEVLTDSAGDKRAPDVSVVESYVKEYFRRAGHPIVQAVEAAEYRVEGQVAGKFDSVMTFRDELVATKVIGSGEILVLDAAGETVEKVTIEPTENQNSLGEDAAFLDLRRYVAKVIWERLSREGKYFGQADVQLLLETLTEGNILGIENLTAELVISKLADLRFEAVPLLIEALSDTRTVELYSTYPGIERLGAEALKVYHVADKALEEIFQKVSRMNLLTPPRHRFVILRGWENEWRRFCPPYRESSSADS